MSQPKRIALLGSTGSIGVQTLDLVRHYPALFQVEVLAARSSAELLISQALEFRPKVVVAVQQDACQIVRNALLDTSIRVYGGLAALLDVLAMDSIDLVLNAIVGFAGLEPTLAALNAGKQVALANKESLVAGGSLVMQTARDQGVSLLPVDSEHAAIFQCLQGEAGAVEKLLLTASGGPFREWPESEMDAITYKQALQHPTWQMGAKVTIDSATLMNKGLEVIEAFWLFGQPLERIEVVVHPQSLVHSMVQFIDGTVKAQLSHPDMRLPILYALNYPERLPYAAVPRLDFAALGALRFYAPSPKKFPCLPLAYHAAKQGGNLPCALNAANEAAVEAFLHGRISFMSIPKVLERVLETISFIESPSLDLLQQTHQEAFLMAQNLF